REVVRAAATRADQIAGHIPDIRRADARRLIVAAGRRVEEIVAAGDVVIGRVGLRGVEERVERRAAAAQDRLAISRQVLVQVSREARPEWGCRARATDLNPGAGG